MLNLGRFWLFLRAVIGGIFAWVPPTCLLGPAFSAPTKIELPVEAVKSCSFDNKGGLLISTASLAFDAKGYELQPLLQPLAGSVFYAETSSSAQPDASFA
jgi:hypothetical protein